MPAAIEIPANSPTIPLMGKPHLVASSKLALGGIVFIGIPLLYFIFFPVSYSFDGTVFSQMLRSALRKRDWLASVQFHHLLYFPLNYLSYHLLEAPFHYRVLEFFHLQLFSMFFGVASLLVIERMLKKLGLDLLLRLASVAMVAFSYAFWFFTVDAEVHIPGFFFITAGMYLLMFRQENFLPLGGAALCFALSAGFHLTNGLIIVTAFFCHLAKRSPWRRFALFFGIYAGILMLMYGAFSLLSGKSVLGILQARFSSMDPYSGYVITWARSLSWPTIRASLASVKTALVAGTALPAALLAAACLALLALGRQRRGAEAKGRFRTAMLFWALPYFLFFSIWDPGNMEFKIHVVVPLLLFIAVLLSGLNRVVARVTATILAGGLLACNLIFGILPQSRITNNTNYQIAQAIRRATPENAQVLITGTFSGYGYGKIYIPYFAGREVLILDWLLGRGHALPEILAELSRRTASGRSTYTLDEVAVQGRTLSDLLDFHKVGEKDRALFASAVRFVPVVALPGGHHLYRLEFRLL